MSSRLISLIHLSARSDVPLLIWSNPGMGKTALVGSAAHSLTYTRPDNAVGTYGFMSFSPATLDPSDLGGIPVPSSDRTHLTRLLAGDFARLTSPSLPPTLLLIDELNRASQPVMNLFLRLIQERMVGEFKLSPSVRIIATANPSDSGARDISAALANRVIHQTMTAADLSEGWHDWMRGQTPAHRIVSVFLERRPEIAYDFPNDPARQSRAWPSFRSWDNAARIIHSACPMDYDIHNLRPLLNGPDGDMIFDLISGLVGVGAATELVTFLRRSDIPSPADTLSGKVGFSDELSILTAQLLSAVAMARRVFTPAIYTAAIGMVGRLKSDNTVPSRAAMVGMTVSSLFKAREDGAGQRLPNTPPGLAITGDTAILIGQAMRNI